MRDAYELERCTMREVRLRYSEELGMILSEHTVRAILRYARRNIRL